MKATFIESHMESCPDDYIQVIISDTWIGIDQKSFIKLFDPFFTTEEERKGTCLGLATVYGIMKQSNVNFYIKSELNKRKEFDIFWLAAIDDKTPDLATKDNKISEGQKEILMVVEKKEGIRSFVFKRLARSGYNVFRLQMGWMH